MLVHQLPPISDKSLLETRMALYLNHYSCVKTGITTCRTTFD